MNHIIISKDAIDSGANESILHSNITFVNLLLEEGIAGEQLHPGALTSYYLDYYDSQYRNGNFSQFVYNSGWDTEVNSLIERGLEQIGATLNLQLFRMQSAIVNSLKENELERFFKSGYFGTNALRDQLKNDAFFSLDESIVNLNAAWLRNHPDLKVLTIDEMFAEAEQIIGRPVARS